MNLRKKLNLLLHKKPDGTEDMVRIEDIEIPKAFLKRRPQLWKMNRALDYFRLHGRVDKPILVEKILNENGKTNKFLLVDNYTRYELLRHKETKMIPVKYIGSL